MARVKIVFPDQVPLFTTNIPVRITDINYSGHVGNDSFLSMVHDIRTQWLRSHGFDELDAGGVGLIMADVMMTYKGEAFYGDVFKAELFVTEITATSFVVLYRLSTEREGKQKEILHARTCIACFDFQQRKVKPMTEILSSLLRG